MAIPLKYRGYLYRERVGEGAVAGKECRYLDIIGRRNLMSRR